MPCWNQRRYKTDDKVEAGPHLSAQMWSTQEIGMSNACKQVKVYVSMFRNCCTCIMK